MDTLSISKKLLAAGFKQEQAEVIAEVIKDEGIEKRLIRVEIIVGVILVVSSAGFGYVVSLLNTIIGKL